MIKHRIFYLVAITVFLVSCIEINLTENASGGKPINIALITSLATDHLDDPDHTLTPTTQRTSREPLPTGTPAIESTPTQSETSTEAAVSDEVATLSSTPTEIFEAGEISAFVSINANCRLGPGIVYDVIRYINEGESVLAAGRNTDNSWFLLMKLDMSSPCWAADQVLELDGDPSSLPLVAAPPTPTPRPSPTPTRIREPQPDGPYIPPSNKTPTPVPYP